jgi:hypothetical protein
MERGGSWVRRACLAVFAATAVSVLPVQQPEPAAAQAAPASKPALFHLGYWYLRNSLTTGPATTVFRYGTDWDIPVMGDWDGDGDDTVGIARLVEDELGNLYYEWHLRDENSSGSATVPPFIYGDVRLVGATGEELGTLPVVGDWDGDGDDTPGVVHYDWTATGPMRWELSNESADVPAAVVASYSRGRDRPVVGDWDGDGDDGIGVVRGDTWLLRFGTTGGTADSTFTFGSASYPELPVPGDWDGNGTDTPAILRNNPPTHADGGYELWSYRNSLSGGTASGQFTFGSDGQSLYAPVLIMDRLSYR